MTRLALPHLYSGKVRELYEVGPDRLLVVATDRVSVFDVVLPNLIPDKGRVLTALAAWWFERTADIVDNHVVSVDPTDLPETAAGVEGRAMLVRRARPLRLECIVRGHLYGSAWREYTASGTVGGAPAPRGLRLAERLETPQFTPTTKAEAGHDEPLTEADARALVGSDRYDAVRDRSLRLYQVAAEHAASRGLVLSDTKFEFGEIDGELVLIDEILTPDSSRYWPAEEWRPGTDPPAFDKQYVRDFVDSLGWDHSPPGPELPAAVVASTRARYVECYEILTGQSFGDWYRPEP